MLPNRGLLRSSPALGLAKAVLPKASPIRPLLSRQFGTALRNSNRSTLLRASITRRTGGPLAVTALSQYPFSLRQARNASTESAIANGTAAASASPADASFLADVPATPVSLTGSDLLDIPEQIGFLKTLGLDYGWGPTSLMQTLLESVYVYTGLPWWASIAVVAVGIRLALLKASLNASENSQRYQELLKDPRYKAATDEMKSRMISGDHLGGAEARAKVSMMNKAAGYSLWRNFVPLLQVPLGIGMFRLMNGMSALPVPSMETGGLLWFTDLTVADPLFIMPVLASAFMAMAMRVPIPYMAVQQQKTLKIMSVVVMPISLVVSLFFPAGVNFYFVLAGATQWLQQWLTYQPWFRRMVGLTPLAKATAATGDMTWLAPRIVDMSAPRVGDAARPAAPAVSENMYQSLKSTLDDAKEKFNERSDRSTKERAYKAARDYDEKRALEEKEKIVARLQQKRFKDGKY